MTAALELLPKDGRPLQERLKQAPGWSEADHRAALDRARGLASRLNDRLAYDFDLVLTPGREFPPETLDELMTRPTARRSTCNRVWSLTGLPALTLPMGMSSDGLPLALQVAGAWGEDARVIQAAAAYEAATPWQHMHPPD